MAFLFLWRRIDFTAESVESAEQALLVYLIMEITQ
jgi:hypothetical protein